MPGVDKLKPEDVFKIYQDGGVAEFSDMQIEDVNQAGIFGNTPLHVACVRGVHEEVDALLAGGADVDRRGERGDTPLHAAAARALFVPN